MASKKKQVVILGVGFGGLYAARELLGAVKRGAIELTLVNKTNFFLFTPLLHEVATGGLSYQSIALPLREIFPHAGVRIYEGDIEKVDAAAKTVTVGGRTIPYDRLVVATGSVTNHYGIPGADTHALPLKNLEDALAIKKKIIDTFERASLAESTERKKLLTFITVGGGATGVELASEVAQFAKVLAERYFSDIHTSDISMHLISASPEILPQFSPKLRSAALSRLKAQQINVHLGMAVKEVTPTGIMTDTGMMEAGTVFWMAGVKPSLPIFEGSLVPTLSKSGRIITDSNLQSTTNADIFAFGDAATMIDTAGKEIPMLAQAATQAASIAAQNVIRSLTNESLRSFSYKNKGALISLGQWFAIGEIYMMKISGFAAWWLWRTVYLFKFPLWRKRIKIALEWTANIFYPRDLTKPE